MPIPPDVVKCYKYIDLHVKSYIEELRKIVKIPSVSSDPNAEQHLSTIIKWMSDRLKQIGFNVILKHPDYRNYKGNKPLIVVGSLGDDPKKKTLLYYCHLDVLKVQRAQWKVDPFELTEIDDKYYGRGTAKMKGPILCFIHAVEVYRELGIELPINIRIICESMNECKSKGLRSVLEELKATFLPQVDCVLLTESNWIGKNYPCIVYGMRGVCYFNLTIEGPRKDLPSGEFGGIVREPMQDFIFIMNSMVDPFDHIKIPNFYEDLVPVTPDEEEFYKKIKTRIDEYRNNVGVDKLGHDENLKSVLMHVWRYPWLNVHYINSTCDSGNSLDIPRKVVARFSIRTVPNQTCAKVSKMVKDFVHKLVEQLKSPNKIDLNAEHPIDPWYEDHQHWNYEAANSATKQVYKEEASFIREGNGFPTLLKLRDVLPKRNILILPIVCCVAKAHSEEENISRNSYIEGTKLLVSYFHELQVAALKHEKMKKATRRQDVCRDKL